MTIDENGMAKTRERKLEIAKRIYDVAVNEFGLKPEDLVYDALTFTLASGDQEFVQTLPSKPSRAFDSSNKNYLV